MDEQPLPQSTDQLQSPPLEQPMSVDEPKPKSKLPLLAALAALIVGAIGGIFFIKRTPPSQPITSQSVISQTPTKVSESMADGKMYTNTLYKFEFSYSPVLSIEDKLSGPEKILLISNTPNIIDKTAEISNYFDILFRIIPINQTMDFTSWIKEQSIKEMPDGKKRSFITSEITPYKTQTLEGFSYVGTVESEIKYVVFKKEDLIYEFSLHGYGTGSSYKFITNGEQIFDQILSTFRFLDQTPAVATSIWKTYTNTNDGFSIEYPNNWQIDQNQTIYESGPGSVTIFLGIGGHGWGGKIIQKKYPAGTVNYGWETEGKTSGGFATFMQGNKLIPIEIINVPLVNQQNYQRLFDQILSTFRFLK